MAGLLDEIRKSELLAQAQSRLQGLLNIPTAAQQFMVSPASFMGLLGKNPLPRETGFAAGATGLPAQEMSVLDPMQAPYMQGYSQGEPVGYAGLALPLAAPATVAAGKALGPKAGQALESYMVNQGMIQPLTAYHGTPHNIQGKFDINKVGTGEGNQTFGYGMYFAENPAVATEYANKLGYDYKYMGKAPKENSPTDLALRWLKNLGWDKEAAKAQWKNEGLGAKVIKAIDNINLEKVQKPGNLYKVDIPDADIPNMLDWDNPFSKQTKSVQEAIKQIEPKIKQINPDINVEKMTGEQIYRAYQQYRGNQPDFASEGLNELGIKGIRYLDQGSRGTGKGSSNFVVFDPSTVKILEKNSEKVEGLLD